VEAEPSRDGRNNGGKGGRKLRTDGGPDVAPECLLDKKGIDEPS